MIRSIFVEFALLAFSLGLAGYFLTLYGDAIARKTGLGGTWVGLAMMATVTSLPELVTGISSVRLVDSPNIALGDALGSCVFNLLLIVLLDFLHRGASVYTRLSQGHILSAGFSVMLLGLVAFGILAEHQGLSLRWRHVGLTTPLILLFYAVAIRTVFQYERQAPGRHEDERPMPVDRLGLAGVGFRYCLAALAVVAAGIRLPITAEHMASAMDWDRTFVGTLFVAMATSLPEVTVTLSALRLGALDMALSDLFGSNLFDLVIVAIDDIAYTRGPILGAVSPVHLISAQSAIMMTGVAIVGLLYRPRGRVLRGVGWVSLLILCLYALNGMVLFLSQDGRS